MARRPVLAPRRQMLRAVLAVGEGDAELLLLRHVRSLLHGRGLTLTPRAAGGKGAQHVIRYTIGQQGPADYAVTLALLDTDTDWNDGVQALARRNGILVVPCAPCLEAVLCEVLNGRRRQMSTEAHKDAFQRHFGHEAHDERMVAWYTAQWPTLEAMRERTAAVAELAQLLSIIV